MALGMIAQTVVVGRIEQRSVLEQQATFLNKFFLCRPPLALLQRNPTVARVSFRAVQLIDFLRQSAKIRGSRVGALWGHA